MGNIRVPLSHFKWLQMGILEPKVLPWQQRSWCQSVSFVMYIRSAKFEEHCPNISGDIFDSVFYCLSGSIYDVTTFLICIRQKREYL